MMETSNFQIGSKGKLKSEQRNSLNRNLTKRGHTPGDIKLGWPLITRCHLLSLLISELMVINTTKKAKSLTLGLLTKLLN